jgi:hypothetical protein
MEGFAKLNLNAWLTYFYLAGNIFLIPLIVNFRDLARWTLRNRWAKIAFMIYSGVTIGLMMETYLLLHYSAPVIALSYYFNVQAIRLWERRDRRLKFLIVPVMFSLVALLLIITSSRRIAAEDNPLSAQAQRASLLARLEQQPGNHVVLVQYGPKYRRDREWVYNRADIDQAKVVWARNMDSRENCKLVGYFKNHVIWSLTIERDDVPVKLSPFSRQSCGG